MSRQTPKIGGAVQIRSFKPSGLLRSLKRSYFRLWQVQNIPDGGQHFTWIANIPQIIQKLGSYARQEYKLVKYEGRARSRPQFWRAVSSSVPTPPAN